MSDRNVQSSSDYDGIAGQSVRSYQSVWMARWTQTTCNVPPQIHSDSHPCTIKELSRVETSDISRSSKGFKEVEARTFGIVNDSVTLSFRNMRNKNYPLAQAMASIANDASAAEYHIQNPIEQASSHIVFANSSFPPSRPLEDDFIGSSSHTVPHKFERGAYSGRTAVTSFMRRQEEMVSKEHLSNTNMRILEQEHHNYRRDYALEKNIDNCLDYGKSVGPHVRKNRTTLLHHEDSMLQEKPESVREQSLRIRTSLNSVEGLTEVPPRFSQSTRDFLITEETNVNLCEENHILRESRALTRFGGKKTSSGTNSFFPHFGSGQQGVKLQPLHSSTDSEEEEEEEENFQHVKAFGVPTNESSAETDTMDMDSLTENPFCGVKSSTSNKVIAVDLKLPTKEEVAGTRLIPELQDMNVKLPALPGGTISADKPEPSTSRTQSLDMEVMLPPSNEPGNSKYDPMESEPSSKWIKRLKLSSSNKKGFVGTTSSNLNEALTHKKVNKFFEVMKGRNSTSEAMAVETAKKDEDINLSNPWIVRWRPRHHDQPPSQQKKPEPVVVCDPQSLNMEDFQKKQFPSTAAMALMGKALSGFQTCELQKRGSFVVWNSNKGF